MGKVLKGIIGERFPKIGDKLTYKVELGEGIKPEDIPDLEVKWQLYQANEYSEYEVVNFSKQKTGKEVPYTFLTPLLNRHMKLIVSYKNESAEMLIIPTEGDSKIVDVFFLDNTGKQLEKIPSYGERIILRIYTVNMKGENLNFVIYDVVDGKEIEAGRNSQPLKVVQNNGVVKSDLISLDIGMPIKTRQDMTAEEHLYKVKVTNEAETLSYEEELKVKNQQVNAPFIPPDIQAPTKVEAPKKEEKTTEKTNGYYYNYDGTYEGHVTGQRTGKEEDVYTCEGKGKEKDSFVNIKKLDITHNDFQRICDIVMKEAGKDDLKELKCIAFTSHNRSLKAGKSWRNILDSSYSSVPDKDNLSDTNNNSKGKHTRSAVISVLTNEKDITKGAEYWDGTDFLAWGNSEQNPYNKLGQNKFDEYKFIEIPKDVYDEFVKAQGTSVIYPDRGNHSKNNEHGSHQHISIKKGDKEVRKIKYNLPASEFTDKRNWITGNFYYETGVKVTNGISGTVSAGKSIFWKLTPVKLIK